MKEFWAFCLFCLILSSCNSHSKIDNVERAFYFWKSEGSIGEKNINELKKLQVKKLYVKVFEVDYSETRGNFPFAKNRISSYDLKELDSVNIVPTLFIKNGIFQYNDEKSLAKLADNIVFLVEKYSKEDNYYNTSDPERLFNYKEIQIDCDWTKSTKDKYFYLLKKIKEFSKKEISCTLRLYPYKYREIMGIPPVDKVSLMCYNLLKPQKEKSKNSILDVEELKKYLNEKRSYPKHLDVALPVFNWTLWYQNNSFAGLLDLSSSDVKIFAKNTKPFWYEVQNDTELEDRTYLKIGDQLKLEEVSSKEVFKAIAIIKKNVKLDKTSTISFFDLDNSTFLKYTNEEINSFYYSFSR